MTATNSNPLTSKNHKAWIPVLEVAAQEVFERMLGSQLISPPDSIVDDVLDITSMVGLAGQICGVIALRCTADTALLMASKMLGVDTAQAGPEMWDAVGEVCNMIAGNFKNKIAGTSSVCMISVPTVITGLNYRLHAPTDSGKIETHFLFEGQPMIVSMEVHS